MQAQRVQVLNASQVDPIVSATLLTDVQWKGTRRLLLYIM